MNKLLITSSAAVIISLSLAGCNTMNSMNNGLNDVGRFGSATVGTGMKYTAQTVGAGAHVVASTGAAVGHGIGSVTTMGVNTVSSPFGMKSTHHKIVYHNGHRYMWKNGSYVLVH